MNPSRERRDRVKASRRIKYFRTGSGQLRIFARLNDNHLTPYASLKFCDLDSYLLQKEKIMTYSTTSGFADLNGSCEISNDDVISYTSDIRGAGTVSPQGGPNLHFKVSFAGVARPYVITANYAGGGFSGRANNGGPEEGEESWAATATAPEAAYAKGE
jgi:hypothetical protein